MTVLGAGPVHELGSLVRMAVRDNPRRRHLLVSTVLGKHVPASARVVLGTASDLGRLVAPHVDGETLVIGYAETATALGHIVADTLQAPYLHTTRRSGHGHPATMTVFEAHSHAPVHELQPWPPDLIDHGDTVVLVDDELSTGRTVLGTIRSLHARRARRHYVVAALVDARPDRDRLEFAALARSLGTPITCVSLACGPIDAEQAAARCDSWTDLGPAGRAAPGAVPGTVRRLSIDWPDGVRECGRHGVTAGSGDFSSAISRVADTVSGYLPGGRVHVLGVEELIYAPLRIALELPGEVTFSSTTRSPAYVGHEEGYPLACGVRFRAHEAGADGERYLYNVGAGSYDAIVLVVDDRQDGAALEDLLQQLASLTPSVLVVTLPSFTPPAPLRGPAFGSYPATDVGWLLTDLSDAELEAPTPEREAAIQAGRNYAETLPVEYRPDAEYLALYRASLDGSAHRLAVAVGVMGERILARRGRVITLASLARAGTPVGVLLRRWAAATHGLDLEHYALSIVRGRGIDEGALAYLALHGDPGQVVFVDGWTGKGAIADELVAAVRQVNRRLAASFDPSLAVLADPAGCAQIRGTRDDLLIPSACLNSTVSGLVSRTVLNDRLLRPGQFHGAKFYADRIREDVSNEFVDIVAAHFPVIGPDVAAQLGRPPDDGPPAGPLPELRRLAARYGIHDLSLVKPGVGETTRVLLRRVPWRVLVDPARADELPHLLLLARRRGVPVEPVPGLPYSCIGLIRPAGRSGAAGTVA